jgi:DNA polymerase-3 subunit delta'
MSSQESRLTRALAAFDDALQAGRVAQAYLVVGMVREEGLPFAEGVVSRLLCEGIIKPCGECPSCTKVRERAHPDVVWIEPEKKSRKVGIERIRELQRLIYQTTLGGSWKVAVLVGSDRVGEEAANAFLKTLEEFSPRSLFLLLSDSPQAMMPTILSRCQRIVLSTEQANLPEPWRTQLMEILTAPMEGGLVSRLARCALLGQLLDQLKKSVKEEEDELTEGQDIDDETLEARVESRFRGLRSMVVRALLFWHRDILLAVCGMEPSLLRYPEQAETIAALAKGLPYRDALRNVQTIEGMQRQFDRNLTQDTVIQATLNALAG